MNHVQSIVEPRPSERVLVTGGTGFIGQHLVHALLKRGTSVRVLVRSVGQDTARALAKRGAELVVGDVRDAQTLQAALQNVAGVFHLAGRLLVPGVPDAEYEQIHVTGTRNLLKACIDAEQLQVIVHCSTTGVLGPTGTTKATEDAPYNPSTVYERTKTAGEQIANEIAQRYGLPMRIARPALVYGPGDLHLLGWFRAIQRGYYRIVGRGDNVLHPIYIDDLVDGLLRCAAVPTTSGRVYHLVGEQPLSIKDLAQSIARAVGRPLPRMHLPLSLALSAARVLEALPGIPPARLPLTRGRVAFMTQSRAYCGERAQRELQFAPQTKLEVGLRRTVAWYRSEGLL